MEIKFLTYNEYKESLNSDKSVNEGIVKTAIGMLRNTSKMWDNFIQNKELARSISENDKVASKGYFFAKSKEGLSLKSVIKAISEYINVYYESLKNEMNSAAENDINSMLNFQKSYKLRSNASINNRVSNFGIDMANFKNKITQAKINQSKTLCVNAINKIKTPECKEWANIMISEAEMCTIDEILKDQKFSTNQNLHEEWKRFQSIKYKEFSNMINNAKMKADNAVDKEQEKNIKEQVDNE